jgi:hypothetical protein
VTTGARSYFGVLTPVAPGRAKALEANLSGLAKGEGSPLARVPGTHYGRWLMVNRMGSELLLFSAVSDTPERDYLRLLHLHLGAEADLVWSHCTGWPGAGDADAAVAWLESHAIGPSLSFGTWQASVDQICAALALRARVLSFALSQQDSEPVALQRAFLQEFGP